AALDVTGALAQTSQRAARTSFSMSSSTGVRVRAPRSWLSYPRSAPPNRMAQGASEPSSAEVLLLLLCACAVLAIGVELADLRHGFWEFDAGDTLSYVWITTKIRTWQLASLPEVRHLWGLGYLAAAVGLISGLPDLVAVLLVSACGSVVSVLLVRRLWG